jgi:hypothetical protein
MGNLKKAFAWAFLTEAAMLEEAIASVSLDKDGGVHTCHSKCQNKKCVERREKQAKPAESVDERGENG